MKLKVLGLYISLKLYFQEPLSVLTKCIGEYDEEHDEHEGQQYEQHEGQQHEQFEQDNYYQQIKNMQLNQIQEQDGEQNMFNNQLYQNENQPISHQQYYEESEGEGEDDDEEEDDEVNEMQPRNPQHNYQQQAEDSENEEENIQIDDMQSKFANMQMENACMFDDDISQEKNTGIPSLQNPQMEPIEEGYSSDESFGTKQKYKNIQENLKLMNQANEKKAPAMKKSGKESLKGKRNHINLRTQNNDNKENVNSKNKIRGSHMEMEIPQHDEYQREAVKRPSTAKMRSSTGFRNTYSRPQTAKVSKPSRRPASGMSKTSTFGSTKKNLKSKMKKKSDPVSRFQAMQNSWSKNKFLSKHKGTKQGRKLDLAGFNQWARMVQSTNHKPVVKQIHRYINPNVPLASNKRDDMRFHLRAKMSQQDYVDKDMKLFHYQKASS